MCRIWITLGIVRGSLIVSIGPPPPPGLSEPLRRGARARCTHQGGAQSPAGGTGSLCPPRPLLQGTEMAIATTREPGTSPRAQAFLCLRNAHPGVKTNVRFLGGRREGGAGNRGSVQSR